MNPEAMLKRLLRHGKRPVAFVGSGLSSNYPSWAQFLRRLAQHVGNDEAAKSLDGNLSVDEMLRVADECIQAFANERAKEAFILDVFANRGGSVPEIFEDLTLLPFAFYLTTNYDTNIEDAFAQNTGSKLPVVGPGEPERAMDYVERGHLFVYKIHGCVERGGPFVIGEGDFQQIIYGRNIVTLTLDSIFALYPVLFLGYGHKDPHISMYLKRQRETVPGGSAQRATFVIERMEHGVPRRNLRLHGVESVPVDSWGKVTDLIGQLAFLQIRDSYAGVRDRFRAAFRSFVETGDRRATRPALLYAFSSSDVGDAQASARLCHVVETNSILRQFITEEPRIHLMYRVVSGQFRKRQGDSIGAAEDFEIVEDLAWAKMDAVTPLRALALRYAGIFWLWPPDRKLQDLQRSQRLFSKVDQLLGDAFPMERLDLWKWQAVLVGETDPLQAGRNLLDVAEEADRLGSRKTAAWCRYSAMDQMWKSGQPPDDIKKVLAEAMDGFEDLGHHRGLGQSHWLLGEISIAEREDESIIEMHLENAYAHAVIAGDNRLKQKCRVLQDNRGGS